MNSVLVTGGAGYIGSHTVIELIKAGYSVTIVDNLCNSSLEAVERVKKLVDQPDRIQTVPINLATPEGAVSLDTLLTASKYHAVIHFAALKAVAESIAKPLEYYHNNMLSLLTILDACKKHDIRNIVFSSSATVYGTGEPPFHEGSTIGQGITNPYGQTKFIAEIILHDFQKAFNHYNVIALRYFNPVGAHSSGTIGEDPLGIPANLMPYITRVATGRLPKLTIHGKDYPTPDGTAQRDYLHVVDLAEGHIAALKYLESCIHGTYEAVNLGTGIPVSVLDMVNTFQDISGTTITHEFGPRRPGDAARVWADATKAKQLLKWEAKLTLKDMCVDSWRWCSMNPHGYHQTPGSSSSSSTGENK